MEISPAADYSLRRYLLEAFEVVTNADSRLLRTFRALLARPGALTAAYFTPERDRYLRPQQVLLFCSVAFFFVQPLTGFSGLTSPLHIHESQTPYSPWAARVIEAEVARRGGGLEAYRAVFDAAVDAHARSLAFLLVPLFALLVAAVFARSGRFFVQHLVFATHFVAFLLLSIVPMGVLLWATGYAAALAGVPEALAGEWADLWGPALFWGGYLAVALRVAYGEGRWRTLARTVALSLGMFLVLTAYRGVLFLATVHGL